MCLDLNHQSFIILLDRSEMNVKWANHSDFQAANFIEMNDRMFHTKNDMHNQVPLVLFFYHHSNRHNIKHFY